MKNLSIRIAMLEKNLKHYEVAELLGITPFTFSMWLRHELPDDKKKAIMEVIKQHE